ncbi:nucleotide-diphospho-sugar transferase [Auriculariales sp. MPI-PUGE-AT-0066]|nr:nucleotide-diphospho-sugar transferase [Auriculariales sp. MPI-PUGE-AT-0066]
MAFAFVTLVTSDAYLPGALVVASALRDLHSTPAEPPEVDYRTVCLVTPETVDVKAIKLLRRTFDVVIGVEVIAVDQSEGLQLLGRPDLHTVLTKLHMLRLTQFERIIFLDADVLPLRPMSHLFNIPHDFAAVPDVGWPDIFNSGVMVFTPGQDKFDEVMNLVHSKGSWDGGDQGVLNEWRGDRWHRLSFKYNTTPTAAYTYAPAYERFGSSITAIHFIGANKPWSSIPFRAPGSKTSHASSSAPQSYGYGDLIDRWFSVYDRHFRPIDVAHERQADVQKYASAWDDEVQGQTTSGVLSLEELKRLAIEGVGSSGIVGQALTKGEGEYYTLPLDGRVDLMRPRPPPKVVVDRPSSPPASTSYNIPMLHLN